MPKKVSKEKKARLKDLGKDLTGQKMPLPVEIIEKNRPSWRCYLLADVGNVIYVAFREGSNSRFPQQMIWIDKSVIEAIKIIEPPFELLEDVHVNQMRNRFGDQWDHDYFKDKNSKSKNKEKNDSTTQNL